MFRIILYAVLIYGAFILFRYFLKRVSNPPYEGTQDKPKNKIDTSKTEDADFEEIK